jgi:serine/threonine-protein kinase
VSCCPLPRYGSAQTKPATARLRHPNTVEVFDYGVDEDGTFYYAMEYLPGLSLDELVSQHGPQPPARVVHVLRQLASALRAAHAAGLIHRDLKPSNVMLSPGGVPHDRVKLLDFGLARPLTAGAADPRLTQEGTIVGTPNFMAPEQVEGSPHLDGRCDLYSLGALGYYLLAGRPPFQAPGAMQTMLAHLRDQPPPLGGSVPADLEGVVMRCLAKRPDERFADAASLERALAGCGCAAAWTEEEAAAWRQRT